MIRSSLSFSMCSSEERLLRRDLRNALAFIALFGLSLLFLSRAHAHAQEAFNAFS
jgi:hypothetical protein